jgi:lysophospholipase L1-like esterase
MKYAALTFALLTGLVLAATPATATTKVFLLAGQSNMAGYMTGLPSAAYSGTQPVHFWNYSNNGWVDLRPGFGDTANDIGPEVGFGYALNHSIFPNDDIYLIKWGVDSTSLAGQWNPNGSGSAYNTFKSRVNAAMANLAGQSPVIAGMIWMQGETDANNITYANAYSANLTNLIAKVRSDFSTPNMPFVVGRITDLSVYGFPGVAPVRTAQQTVPGQVGHALWINTDDLDMNPDVPGHYIASGQIELGIRFANALAPEPTTFALIGTGLLALAVGGLRKRLHLIENIGSRCVSRTLQFVAIAVVLAIATDGRAATALRIMPLGDSITAGYTDPTAWTVPFTFGYRGPLYTKLTNAGYSVQFVGSSGEPWNLPFGSSFGVPTSIQGVDLRPIGQDNHRGYGGVTTSQILNGGHISGSSYNVPNVAAMLNADNPDVVLLMVGINGVADGMSYIDPLVNQIVTTKPNAKLIIAQITPRSSYQSDIVNYNNYIKNTVVPKYQALGKHVTTVDQYSNLLTNKNNLTSIDASLFTDSAHLRPVAYDRLAQTWLAGIQAVASVPEPGSLSLVAGCGLFLAARACWRARRRGHR